MILYLYFRENVSRTSFLEKDYEEDECVDELTQLLLGDVMLVKEEDTSSKPQHLLHRQERKLKTKRSKNFKVKRTTRHSFRRLLIFFHFLPSTHAKENPEKQRKLLPGHRCNLRGS